MAVSCWELDPGLRKEQPMLLTAGLSLQPIDTLFNKKLSIDSGLVVVVSFKSCWQRKSELHEKLLTNFSQLQLSTPPRQACVKRAVS